MLELKVVKTRTEDAEAQEEHSTMVRKKLVKVYFNQCQSNLGSGNV